jgi:hypothetical protein
MSVQNDIGYLLTVAQEADKDTSKIEEKLRDAKYAESQGNHSLARDHMKVVLTGGEGFNSDSPVGVLHEEAQDRAKEVYDKIVSEI